MNKKAIRLHVIVRADRSGEITIWYVHATSVAQAKKKLVAASAFSSFAELVGFDRGATYKVEAVQTR